MTSQLVDIPLKTKETSRLSKLKVDVSNEATFKENLFKTLEKKGALGLQYAKRINVNLQAVDETFRQYNCKAHL